LEGRKQGWKQMKKYSWRGWDWHMAHRVVRKLGWRNGLCGPKEPYNSFVQLFWGLPHLRHIISPLATFIYLFVVEW